MRWKALWNSKNEKKGVKTQWYRLKSSKTPNQMKNVIPVEDDLVPLVENMIWRKSRNAPKNIYWKTLI